MTESQRKADPDPAESIAAMEREFNRMQREVRLVVQDRLASFVGRSMADLAANQRLVQQIHQLLDGYGLRIRCNECGHPAILRVSPRSGSAGGVFVFDHTIDGRRTFHGGRGFMPAITLVAKPPRKIRSSGSKEQSGRVAG